MKQERKKGKRKRKRFVSYDYEAAYDKMIETLHEWVIEQMYLYRKKTVYALKEIKAGEQFEIEIYPQFKSVDEVPEAGRKKRDNSKAQKSLNEKNARKYIERKINENFGDADIWMTLTYDSEHLPQDGDMDAADHEVVKFIKRVNYQRKKKGLPKAKYVFVTEYNADADIRWHHHIVMDGALDMDTVEKCWKNGRRNEVRRLQKDENGLSGMANYIVKQKNRLKSEKRWHCSQGLKEPDVKIVHSKQKEKGKGNYKPIGKYVDEMVRDQGAIEEILGKWYPDFIFTGAQVYYNDFNYMFYIYARMRRRKGSEENKNRKARARPDDREIFMDV